MVTNTTAALGGQFTVNPVSGTHKYVIMDPKPFGTESTNKVPNQFAWGTATGGASTYLEDLNKNWIVNQWAGKKVKILAGSGVGNYPNEIPIASNTATRLTFGITGTTGTVTAYTLRSVETNPDATTVYAIMDNWGQSTGGGQFATAIGTGSGGSNYVAGDIVAVTGGSGFNNIYKVAGTGAVTNVMLLSVGTGYTAGTNLTTTPLTGCGSGLTLNTTAQTASLATTTITADFIQPVMGAIGTLIPVQNWGVATITSKRARLLSGLLANVCYESTVATGTANTLTITANGSNNIDGCSQYAILGISPRGVSNTTIGSGINLIRLFGTTYINKAQYMISWRGGGTSEVDRYDMVNDYWDYLTIFPVTETYTGGSMYEYNGKDRIYVTKDATGRVMYYDLVKNIIVPCSTIPYGHGTVLQGNRMFSMSTTDLFGSNLEYLYMMRHNASEMWRVLVYW